MASRYCKVCGKWHDLETDWPESCYGHFRSYRQSAGVQIIKDIEPYKAVAPDIAAKGRPVIKSRREHREFLKRNNYVEMGHATPKPKAWDYGQEISPRDVKHTIDQLRSQRER